MYFDKIDIITLPRFMKKKRFVTVVGLFYDFFLPIDLFFSKMENFLCGMWYLEKIPSENTPLVQNN